MSDKSTASPPVIVGLGEILWDIFPDGPRFGGAPANFACSAAELAGPSARVYMASAVGRDEPGLEAIQQLQSHGVETETVSQSEQPTGTVTVQIDAAGHASYEFAADTAWDRLAWSDELGELAGHTDAVCFGTLGQRSEMSRKTIRQFVKATPESCLRMFDVNLRSPFWDDDVVRDSLPLANALKCNEDELPVLASLFGLTGSSETLLHQLADRFELQLVAFTRGAEGSQLRSAGEMCDLAGTETQVVDTVGAGDSFTAALVLGHLNGLPLGDIHAWADRVAAYLCTQPGATPAIPERLHFQAQRVIPDSR